MKVFGTIFTVIILCLSSASIAEQEPLVFTTQLEQDRFDQLTQELRCVVCQNQSLADSDAPLAHDLRREVYSMMQTGQSNQQIKQFLVERYGDFVLYRPPVQSNTVLLWLAPIILLLAGAWLLRANVKKRTALLAEDENHDQPDD